MSVTLLKRKLEWKKDMNSKFMLTVVKTTMGVVITLKLS